MNLRTHVLSLFATAVFVTAGVGCQHQDRPHDVGRARPPVDQLDERDSGLQSPDLLQSTDQMTQDLLSLPELNLSDRQWTIVTSDAEDQTTGGGRRSYNIFVDRLKTNIGRQGRGRVRLIENRDRYRALQSRELEPGAADEFGQGGGRTQTGGAGIQPDNLTNLHTREQVWSNDYIVKVER
jgi:hypothetical protein